MRCKLNLYSSAISQLTCRVSKTYTSPFTINTIHRTEESPLYYKLTNQRRSLKRKENCRKLLLLGIQTGDKLYKQPFFVAYSRLRLHCRTLAEGGCLLSRFHFTLCRYFLGHVACWNSGNLPWQGLLIVNGLYSLVRSS